MIRIAQASSSEVHTKTNPGKFGLPPNQLRTGATKVKPEGNIDGELNIIPWYEYGWTAVFRFKDEKIADRAAWIVQRAVENGGKVGYGQQWITDEYPMTGLFDALFDMPLADPWKITTPVNCTCATLIGAGAYFGGVREPALRLLNTAEQEKMLMATGAFVKLTDAALLQSGVGAKRGDIFHKIGHTMMVLDDDPHRDMVPYRLENCAFCNLREGPGTNHKIIKELAGGRIVNVISTAYDDDGDLWRKCSVDGLTGYISGIYLPKHLPTARITFDCWLRATAGKSGKALVVIPQGAADCYLTSEIKKVGLTPWRGVIYADRRGWASGNLVKT